MVRRARRQIQVLQVTRKIHFYDARLREGIDEEDMDEIDDPSVFSHRIAALQFTNVPPGDPTSRYLNLRDGNLVAVTDIGGTPFGIRGVIGTIRRTALPDVERLGRLRGLALEPDSGLFEATHFTLFLPERILGLEFNVYGPRTGRLAQYLMEKCPDDVDDVDFVPILRQDVREKLRDMGEVSVLQIAVRRDGVEITRQLHESLPEALSAIGQIAHNEAYDIVQVGIRMSPYSRRGFHFPFARGSLLGFLGREEMRENVTDFSVKARNTRTNRVELFDLLEDKMVSEVRVIASGTRRRSVDSRSMYQALEETFREKRRELLNLVGRE